jgi:hypothetical protein
MASYERTISVPRPLDVTFAFVSSFDNASIWDPRTYEAANVTPGPVGEGTTFVLRGGALRKQTVRRLRLPLALISTKLPYEVTEFDPPNRFVMVGENALYRYDDHITFTADGDNTSVHYAATLELRGPMRIFGWMLNRQFRKIGNEATNDIAAAVAASA